MRLPRHPQNTRKLPLVPKQDRLETGKFTSMKRMPLLMKPLVKLLALVPMRPPLRSVTFIFSKALIVGLEILKGVKPQLWLLPLLWINPLTSITKNVSKIYIVLKAKEL